jgi:hypothetical protein
MRVVGDADDVPVKDLTLLGYMQADNSGATAARATYQEIENLEVKRFRFLLVLLVGHG